METGDIIECLDKRPELFYVHSDGKLPGSRLIVVRYKDQIDGDVGKMICKRHRLVKESKK